MATDHYDVVIIGSGAGGGRSRGAWPRRASGSCSSSGATTCPGRRDNWDTEAVFLRGHYTDRAVGGRGRRRLHARAELLRRGEHQVLRGRAVPAPPGGLRGDPHHGGTSPAWPLGYQDFEPWYARAEQLYVVHGAAGKTRPTARGAATSRSRRCSTSPHPAAPRRPRAAGAPPVAPADRGDARPGRAGRRPPRAGASAATEVDRFHAWSTPRPTPRRLRRSTPLAHPNLDLVTNAKVERRDRR